MSKATTYVELMINGSTVATKEQLLKYLPKYVTTTEQDNRIFYRVGEFEGLVAAWDNRRKVGVILDDYKTYICEQRRKRSER